MGIDLVEGILRHSGYLNQIYVRLTPEDRLKQFHEGEAALFITRADHRVQSGKLSALEQQIHELQARLKEKEQAQQTRDTTMTEILKLLKELPAEKRAEITREL